ncbi:MAG: type II CRISPR RNA-guided endonuclease Cas9 [Cardiobacteriaceae bacterium]|nr:type II CRISPR RNA-guided endonuclease Cas9 [Cardiobacteriaceae bacterium]
MHDKNYIIGLDLGIASVGWACVQVDIHTDKDGKEQAQPIGLLDCGVRCFAAAEEPKTGESLNAARRQARSQRRTIKRRASRMRQVRKLLFKHGLLTKNEFQAAYSQNTEDKTFFKKRNKDLLKAIGVDNAQDTTRNDGAVLSGSLNNNRHIERSEISQDSSPAMQVQNDGVLKGENGYQVGGEKAFFSNVWQLRVDALHRKLQRAEFAAVICHLIKHRGYLSTRKSERKNADAETGKMLAGVSANEKMIKDGVYSSPAEIAVYHFLKEHGQMRNKQTLSYKRITKGENKGQFELDDKGQKIPIIKDGVHQKEGSYLHTFNRLDLENELQLIFDKQKAFGNQYANNDLCGQLKHILHYQNPALQGDALKKMWGKCSVYEQELRAPKASYTGERFVWISKLNNLKINNKSLSEEQRLLIKELPFEQTKLTFTQIRKKLGLADNAHFNLCRYVYDKDKSAEENLKKSEDAPLFEAKFYHSLKKEYKNLPTEWEALKNNPAKLDQIGEVLAFYKEDNDRKQHLSGFSPQEIDAILGLNFDKSLNLSLKCIREILPLMEMGKRYDEACKEKYGDHYGRSKNKHTFEKLPIIDKKDSDTPNNPVVYRTITQARKIINAIIAAYGKPFRVHIEMGRDLGKSRDDRNKIEKRNKENQAERERERQRFIENHGFEPKGKDILLYRLYQNQHGKCLYSGKAIDLTRIFDKGYVEIDHAIPFSRSWDDSQNNKVLVLGAENQNKGNKTPFEWFGDDEQKWREFEARVNACRFSSKKKQNILRRELEEGFSERNINDTRYATRFLKNYLENNLAFSGSLKRDDGTEVKKVFAPQGQITALLRSSWGFAKVREDNDRHHALDAIIVACATESMQQKITQWYKDKKDKNAKNKYEESKNNLILEEDKYGEKHYKLKEPFPVPWDFFRNEINLRVFNQVEKIDTDTGEVLWEVLDIEQRDELLDLIRDKLPDRPAELAQHEFVQPLFVSRKVHKHISGQGHLETLYSKQSTHKNKPQSGIDMRGGIVANASMIRIDIFAHKTTGKNYIVPIYAHQAANGELPNRAIVGGKDKDGNKKQWLEMTDEYQFIYSFYPYDLIEITDKKNPQKRIFGYYRQCNIASGGIDIQQPEDDWVQIKKYQNKWGKKKNEEISATDEKKQITLFQGVGIQNMTVKKYAVDVLGRNITPIEPEQRQGFDAISDDDE